MNRIRNACNIKVDKNNYLRDTTACKSCYLENRRRNNSNTLIQNVIITSHKQPKIENVNIININRSTLLVGPTFSGITYLLLKIFSRSPSRNIYIITKSPPEHYSNSKIKIREISE